MWNRFVTIEIKGQTTTVVRDIRTTREAASCLLTDWPKKSGEEYKRAIIECTNVLKGDLPEEAARYSFIVAAKAASVMARVSNDILESDAFIADLTEACTLSLFNE